VIILLSIIIYRLGKKQERYTPRKNLLINSIPFQIKYFKNKDNWNIYKNIVQSSRDLCQERISDNDDINKCLKAFPMPK
jgi:hypothetical protein